LVENILVTFEDKITQQIGMNTTIKMWNRCKSDNLKTRLKRMISTRKAHIDFETQIRSNEYKKLLEKSWDGKRGAILEAIPPPISTISYVCEKPTGAMDLNTIAQTKLPTEVKKIGSDTNNDSRSAKKKQIETSKTPVREDKIENSKLPEKDEANADKKQAA